VKQVLEQYDDVLTTSELMEVLFISRNTACNLLKNGEIKAKKVGGTIWRIPKTAVMEYLGYNTQRQRFTL